MKEWHLKKALPIGVSPHLVAALHKIVASRHCRQVEQHKRVSDRDGLQAPAGWAQRTQYSQAVAYQLCGEGHLIETPFRYGGAHGHGQQTEGHKQSQQLVTDKAEEQG